MKALIFISLYLFSYVAAKPAEQYTDKYDGLNVKEVIGNRRLLIPYMKCLLDQAKCAPDAKELKSHIIDALENYCAKCTKAQREGVETVIAHLINNEPDYWRQLTVKYDPDMKFTKLYEKELKAIKA